jgi:TolA-binding protein
MAATDIQPLLNTASEQVINRIQGTIDEIHQEASRAADTEVEEFRQMQQQRIQELEEQLSNLSARIEDLSDQINSSDEGERVEALKERKELKTEHEDIEAELDDLQQRRDQGFPGRQREIRERHALNVQVKPLTITEVEYERGELEMVLATDEHTLDFTAGYGTGVGITETVNCSKCGRRFTDTNPVQDIAGGLICLDCY